MQFNDLSPKRQKTLFYFLSILRIGIGWHLLYEGLLKLFDPEWTALAYLNSAYGPLSGFFHALAANPDMLQWINILNMAGLVAIGLFLFAGFLTRFAQMGAIVLLSLYYISHPPIFTDPGFFREGSYLIMSKDLLEIIALLVLMFFNTGKFLGIDGLIASWRKQDMHQLDHGQPDPAEIKADIAGIRRRELLKHLATLPFMGGVFYGAIKKSALDSAEEQYLVDSASGATASFVRSIQSGGDRFTLESLKGQKFDEVKNISGPLPTGKIGNLESARLILGGNLISGYVHSRDLIYVSSLVRNYHQKDRVFRTLMLAEQSGVNTILSNPVVMPIMKEYWNEGYGKIQFISDMAGLDYSNGIKPMPFDDYYALVRNAIEDGANAAYIQGETADYYIENNLIDKLVKVMDLVRSYKIPVGIGAHKIETIKRCVELGLETDFWMKTLHTHNYWSAQHPTWHDNMYCYKPEETIAFMESLPQPWIAFKILAAGALKPEEAFQYAFRSGADFICVGMYDFQIVDDTNIAFNSLNTLTDRSRPWC